MYKKGDLNITEPDCDSTNEDGACDDHSHEHRVMDSRARYDRRANAAFLVHSCGEWVIGGPDEIRIMIADLHDALQKLTV